MEEGLLSLPAEIIIYFQPYTQEGARQSKGKIIKRTDMG